MGRNRPYDIGNRAGRVRLYYVFRVQLQVGEGNGDAGWLLREKHLPVFEFPLISLLSTSF